MALIIVADDLTGACDAGTLFAGKAPVPVTVWPDPPVAAEVAVVDTESRRLDRAAATDRVSDAAGQRAGATSWFKKIDSTLRGHVGAALALDPVPLLAGSAGLAQPLAERLGLHAGCATLPGGRWLIVAGSLHPATRRQIAAAGRAGLHVLATADAEHADGGDAAATLAREAASLLATESFDLIVLTGGDTAVAFYRTLGAARIDLVGAPGPGLALGYLRAPGYSALPVLTKAGGFGPPELFVSLRKEAMT